MATYIAIFALCFVPIALIVLFWMVHVLPEKIAHKRHHPQLEAIKTLCLLSLVFGGLLWPIAWLWAYTKPVGYKLAYGTDKSPDYFKEHSLPEPENAAVDIRQRVSALEARGVPASELDAIRADLAALESRLGRERRSERGAVMEVILLGIYSFFVWLIFIKFKLLPWTTPFKVAVAIIPVVALATMLLLAEHLRADDHRCQGHQVHRARRVGSPGTGDRGAGPEQPTGEEG